MQSPSEEAPFYLTVYTTTACNLACPYCFQHVSADVGLGLPKRIPGANLSEETAGHVLEFAKRRMAELRRDRLEIMLFGGEPLLNPDGCLRLLEQAGPLGLIGAAIVTNGTLLERARLTDLAAAGLRFVQVTFDGGPEDHDRVRARRSGGGTFDDICSRLAACRDVEGVRWQMRVNVSHQNAHSIDALIDALPEHVALERTSMMFALVNDVGIGYSNRVGYESATLIRDWHLRALERGFAPTLPTAPRQCATCGEPGGGTGAVVNADGELFSCWDTVGRRGWRVGDVREGYDARLVAERWVSCDHRVKPHGTGSEAQLFADTVDGGILDWLHERDRLHAVDARVPEGSGAVH